MPPVSETHLRFDEQHRAIQDHIHYECQVLDDGKSVAEIKPADAVPPESQGRPIQPVTVKEACGQVLAVNEASASSSRLH